MRNGQKLGTALACLLLTLAGAASAQEGREQGHDQGHDQGGHEAHNHAPQAHAAPRGEPHPGPSGYQRLTEPRGWNARPATVDRQAYQHNFRAARSFHVGPYHRPRGWAPHTWAYGQILPRAYWAPQYLLSDYWLFALEVPPAGYEWVRDGADALLISTDTGEILQVEYGVFA
jgi:Ni/Co efflux regulator RcnB